MRGLLRMRQRTPTLDRTTMRRNMKKIVVLVVALMLGAAVAQTVRIGVNPELSGRYATNELGASGAIVFRQQDDDYSFGLAGFFAEEFEALGGETVVVDYVSNTADFPAQ